MHRFLVAPDVVRSDQVVLPPDVSRQIGRVLRMQAGDRVVLLDGSGWEIEVVLTRIRLDAAVGEVVDRRLADSEPGARVVLYQSLLKRDRFEWVLQKCTEIGVAEFTPIVCSRTVSKPAWAVSPGKLERWGRIVGEAVEQSRRGRLPALRDVMTFGDALAQAERSGALGLIPWEAERSVDLRTALANHPEHRTGVSLFIGPEGGFADEEIALAKRHGVVPITLGRRVLRAETAAVVAVALVLHELGEMR